METILDFYYNLYLFHLSDMRPRGTMVGYSTLKLRVVGSNPAADIPFSTQIAVLMQNLGLILFKNHELCSLAHFGTVKLYMG